MVFLAISAGSGFSQPSPWFRTNGPGGGNMHFMAAGPGDTLYAGAELSPGMVRLYRSTDLGTTWSLLHGGSGFTIAGPIFCSSSGEVLAGAAGMSGPGEIVRSTDGGNSWTEIASGFLPSGFCSDDSGALYASSSSIGIFRSTDAGLSWIPANGNLSFTAFSSVTADSTGTLYAAETVGGSSGAGVYRSTDGGAHWARTFVYSLTVIQALVRTRTGAILAGTYGDGIYRSSDGGASWPAASDGLSNKYVTTFASDRAGDLFAGTLHGLFRSTDDGESWAAADNGMMNRYVRSLAVRPGNLFAGTLLSIFCSTDAGTSWNESASGIVSSFCTLVAASRSGAVVAATNAAGGLYRTTDSGSTWLAPNPAFADKQVLSLTSGADGAFFAGISPDTDGVAVFRSTDAGATWKGLATPMKSRPALALAAGGNGEVAAASITGNEGTGIYLSTDNGNSWSTLTTGLANISFNSILVNGSGVLYAGYHGGLPVSTDGGATWNDRSNGLPYAPILALAVDSADNVFAATGEFGVYRLESGDWILLDQGVPSFDEGSIVSLAFDGSGNMYGGSDGEGAYMLPRGGATWRRYNVGLSDTAVNSVTIAPSGYLYAGTNGDGVFRNGGTPLTSASAGSGPAVIQLSQNYPNPFNPRTVIRFSVQSAGDAALRVFNVLGQAVATLIDGRVEAGVHEVTWDASRCASGAYFYELRTGTTRLVKQMALMK